MFVILAAIIILSSIATVATKSVIRAATYLLFVLLGTAGMYFLMGYTFLGAVQTMVYAGGIIVLYVFAILLTDGAKGQDTKARIKDASWGFILALVGFLVFLFMLLKQNLFANIATLDAPLSTASATPSSPRARADTCSPSRPSAYSCWHVSWLVCSSHASAKPHTSSTL